MIRRLSVLIFLTGFFAFAASASASPQGPFASLSGLGGPANGLTCTVADEGSVRFCQGNGTTDRIPTWDGVPLDVDVTLPPVADGSGPFPTIVMMHGYGSSKTEFESTTAAGSEPDNYNFNNDYYAQHGYEVVNYTVRGFGKSCGSAAEHATPACLEHGFIHLADQRYEARDTEYLLGILADEGYAKVGDLGVTGLSYGGGQSIELAYLKNRIRCAGSVDPYAGLGSDPCAGAATNAFVPWVSPAGEPLEINAAYARWPWSDLTSALIPNGRFLDYDNATDGQDGSSGSESPVGVAIQSYITGLYLEGSESGYYEAPATTNLEFNITKDDALIAGGEPTSAEEQEVINNTSTYHGGYGLSGTPAPLLMENGWNDDLFPPLQALRVYNSVRATSPGADVALQFGDIGHSRASNKPRVNEYFNDQAAQFFAAHLNSAELETAEELVSSAGPVSPPAAGSVTTFTTTCPSGAGGTPDGGPFEASSWSALPHGQVVLSSATEQTVTEPGGNPALGVDFDPIAQDASPNACKEVTAEEPVGTASYSVPVGQDFTLMGLPTISAAVEATGTANGDGQLDARLFDVLPSGKERLVSRGGFRLEEPQTPKIVFQLHGNGYEFKAGDTVKLELTSNDLPYYQKAKGAFTIKIKSATIALPTLNAPNGEQILPLGSSPLPLPESPLSPGLPPPVFPVIPPAPVSPPTTITPPVTPPPVVAKCAVWRTVRIAAPHYRGARVTSVTVFVNGKRIRVIRSHLSRTIVVSLKGQTAKSVSVKLSVRVSSHGHAKTHTVVHSYHPCVSFTS